MEFSWTEEQSQIFEQARRFALQTLEPPLPEGLGAAELEPRWRERWRQLARFGALGANTPARYGGQELDARTAIHLMEGLGYGCADNGLLFALGAQLWSVVPPLVAFGSEAQKSEWLPQLATGASIAAFGLTESEAGSDVYRLQTRAWPEAGGYWLEGGKVFVTNAPLADLFLVFATTRPEAGFLGMTALLVRRASAGVTVGPAMHKMGLETSPMAEVRFDRVWVPAAAVVGEEGGGGAVLQHTLEWERGCLLAPSLGAMQRLLEQTTAYCRARKQFGRPIGEFEAVAAQLAEMRLRLELARLAVYRFAWMKDEGRSAVAEASMVKLYLSESWRLVAQTALHLHGAAGYMRGPEFERTWRDAMASSLFSGTTEMQRNLIAESLLRPARARSLEVAG